MTTRPLPLPGWAMRALDEERLTQWRVPLEVQPVSANIVGIKWPDGTLTCNADRLSFAPGDVLWVREAWAHVPRTAYLHSDGIEQTDDPSDPDMAAIYKYGFDRCRGGFGWRSPVTMPRWASRWTLTVESVRVERAWSATETDAMAMGLPPLLVPPDGGSCPHLEGLEEYWRKRHGPGAWERNDWCAVVGWRAERRNVDA